MIESNAVSIDRSRITAKRIVVGYEGQPYKIWMFWTQMILSYLVSSST